MVGSTDNLVEISSEPAKQEPINKIVTHFRKLEV